MTANEALNQWNQLFAEMPAVATIAAPFALLGIEIIAISEELKAIKKNDKKIDNAKQKEEELLKKREELLQKIEEVENQTNAIQEERHKLDQAIALEESLTKRDAEMDRLNNLANENAESYTGKWRDIFLPEENKESTTITRPTPGIQLPSTGGTATLPNVETKPINPPAETITKPNTEATEEEKNEVEELFPGNNKEFDKESNINVPNINDTTEENLETSIAYGWSMDEWIKYMEDAQQKQWQREDEIRKEAYEREDNAYQRAVKDMQKAGINPNLMNVQPADTGSGITTATGLDYSGLNKKMETVSNELIKLLDREFNEDENTKKNITNLISQLLSGIAMYATFKKAK